MLCFGGATIDVTEPVPVDLQQLQEEPPWLSSFLDSEDYLTDCPLNCFEKTHDQEHEQSGAPGTPIRPHRRRYFCIECPEEGALCVARVMGQHVRHRVLKIRKVTGIGSLVIKVRDIDPLLNIDYVNRLSSTTDEFPYVKLRSFRKSVWGRIPQQVLCYECLRLASSASKDDQKYKYCSIKCAYPTSPTKVSAGAGAVSKLLSPRDQLGGCISSVTSMVNDNLQPPRILTRSMSCRTTNLRHDREFPSPPGAAAQAPETPVPASPTTSASRGWRSRLSRFLSFSSSRKHIPHMENLSPSTVSSQERSSSSWERFHISPWKESEGEARQGMVRLGAPSRGVDQGQVYGRPPRQTLLERRQSLGNERVNPSPNPNHTPKESAKVASKDCSWATSVESDESLLVKSTSNVGASVRRLNDQNVRAGAGTRICWRPQEGNVSDVEYEVVQDRWGAMRGRVLSSESMPYVRIKLENELSQRRSSLEPLQVSSSTVPAAPYTMKFNAFLDVDPKPEIRSYRRARVAIESAVYPGPSEETPAPARGFGHSMNSSEKPISKD